VTASGGGSTVTPIIFGCGNTPEGVTEYDFPGACASSAPGAPSPVSGTLSHLYVNVINTPPSGQTFQYTVYVGYNATSITCTISSTTNTCPDITHTAAVTAGQLISVFVNTSASSGPTGAEGFGLELTQ
jgi:hypothetical protein